MKFAICVRKFETSSAEMGVHSFLVLKPLVTIQGMVTWTGRIAVTRI